MTVQLAPPIVFQSFLSTGAPNAFGNVFTYIAGTATPQATWIDSTQTTQNQNPVPLNALGQASIWLATNLVYKIIVQDSLGNQINFQDQVIGGQSLTAIQQGGLYGTDSGSVNAYIFTHNVVTTPASLAIGTLIRFIPLNTNTGASTLNADGTGAVAVIRANGSALTGGELSSLGPVVLQSTGTQWQIVLTAGAQPGYERTSYETAAAIIPPTVGYSFLPPDLRRYSTNIFGSDSAGLITQAIFNAVTAVRNGGGPGYILHPGGTININNTIMLPPTISVTGVSRDDCVFNYTGTTSAFQHVNKPFFYWRQSTAFNLNDVCYNFVSLHFYVCTTAGTSNSSGTGPSGVGSGIVDGTCVWSSTIGSNVNTSTAGSVNFSGIKIITSSASSTGAGIELNADGGAFFEISNCRISGNFLYGVIVDGTDVANIHNNIIENNWGGTGGASIWLVAGPDRMPGQGGGFTNVVTIYANQLNTGGGAALSGVTITGTGGQFSCTATSIAVNTQLTISGTFGGTGSITGYVNPTTYVISATNGSTTFTLTALGGGALTTTAGTPTGLTYNSPSWNIIDDGGQSHSFSYNNLNGGAGGVRICAVNFGEIVGNDMENAGIQLAPANVLFTNTTGVSGASANPCNCFTIQHNNFGMDGTTGMAALSFQGAGHPAITVINNHFRSNLGMTASIDVTQLVNSFCGFNQDTSAAANNHYAGIHLDGFGNTLFPPQNGYACHFSNTLAAAYLYGDTRYGPQFQGGPGTYACVVNGNNASGTSFGLIVQAGKSSGDNCFICYASNQSTQLLQLTGAGDLITRGVGFCLRATAVETRTSTTTLTNSTQLTYNIPAAGTYEFELEVFSYFTTAVTDGITANVNYSGTFTAVGSYLEGYFMNGTTTAVGIQPVQVSATVNNALAGLTLATYGASVSSTTPAIHRIKGNLIATGTGTLAFAFAQSTSGVDTANLGVGSYMKVTQLS